MIVLLPDLCTPGVIANTVLVPDPEMISVELVTRVVLDDFALIVTFVIPGSEATEKVN